MEIASLEKVCRTVRRDIINMTADAASGQLTVRRGDYHNIVFRQNEH